MPGFRRVLRNRLRRALGNLHSANHPWLHSWGKLPLLASVEGCVVLRLFALSRLNVTNEGHICLALNGPIETNILDHLRIVRHSRALDGTASLQNLTLPLTHRINDFYCPIA